MDAFELLKQDHKKVSTLFSKIESASGQAKSELFDQLKAELDLHAHIEEIVLYPALENTEEAREITLEAYEEHKVVKNLLGELANAADQNEEWDAKLKVLKENVEHHVEEEEGELFGKARKALGQERIETLGVELEAEKASKSGAPKPRKAPESNPTAARNNEIAKSESSGVLQRLANLVGLGESSSDKQASTTRKPAKSPAEKSSKRQAAKAKSTSASKNAPVSKATSKASSKSGPAKSAKSTPKAAARKPRAEARSSKRAATSSKNSAARGTRSSATKTASRAASNQRVKAGSARGTKKARASKSSSGTRNKSR